MAQHFACLAVLLGALGCELDGDNLCPLGFKWDKNAKECRQQIDIPQTDTSLPSSDDSEADTDIEGLGTPCALAAQCEDFDANYCALDPQTKKGACTISPCEKGACPADYKCCDCTKSSKIDPTTACLVAEQATAVELMANCICD